MLRNLSKNKILWLTLAGLTILAALAGVVNKAIYENVVVPSLWPGAYGQDLISIAAAIILVFLALAAKENSAKKQVVALGILGYLFYAYGIYVIEQAYNSLYLVYMAIWTLSFWGMVYGIAGIRKDVIERYTLSNPVRRFSIAIALLQPLVFYPLWIFALLPLMREGNRIENLFSIYIIDLCFIMPAFLILAWMLMKKNPLSFVLAPALLILGFTIIFSLVVSELVKPMFGEVMVAGNVLQSGGLSALFLIATIIHLYKLRIDE